LIQIIERRRLKAGLQTPAAAWRWNYNPSFPTSVPRPSFS